MRHLITSPDHQIADLLVLLLDIVLRTALLRLANIMLLLSFQLGITVTSDTTDGTTDGS